ncbi:hypothetical protein BDK92_5957 [Micromonospora pisi]|uniref:ABC-type transport system involved in multi-copper enzyme maturation permease subunit n=1 Tax=Micromonospora pisi TaxID=589240 RepID=A0A495JRF8_9ACTN|nr:hypothetical protein [Micromonospora pisi]RKR91557.1 hypothetical protein BDK92_5957 [Micromonospora pisi]
MGFRGAGGAVVRTLTVELRRSAAPAAAVALCVAGVWLLAAHPDEWGGRWAGLANYLRISLLVLCPLMVAGSAWQAGRERRCGMDEMLGSVPRPTWQPLLVAWTAVSLAGTAGLLVPFAVAAVLVGRVATYGGGAWWWTLVGGVLALWTASALGVLLGRRVRSRVIAPIAGLATYVGLAIPGYLEQSGPNWLSPAYSGWSVYRLVPEPTQLWQGVWLLALTATLLALAAGLRAAASLAGLLAIVAAATIVTGAGPRLRDLREDPEALRSVCTTAGPSVCLARINAFLLEDVATAIQPLMRRIEGIPGAPVRVADYALKPPDQSYDPAEGTLWLSLDFQSNALGGLSDVEALRIEARQVVYPSCNVRDEEAYETRELARAWLFEEPPESDVPIDRLRALPADRQRAWFTAYLAASRDCDGARLVRLRHGW